MAKGTSFLAKSVTASLELNEQNLRARTRRYVLDMVCIALGELDWKPGSFEEFAVALNEAELYFSNMIVDEHNDEKYDKVGSIWVSKNRVDQAYREAVGDKHFYPFEVRYSDTYPEPTNTKDALILGLKDRIKKLEKGNDNLNSALKTSATMRENLEDTISELRLSIDEKDAEIEKLKAKVNELKLYCGAYEARTRQGGNG